MNFNFGVDCPNSDIAENLMTHINGVGIYQDGHGVYLDRLSIISKTGMLDVLTEYAKSASIELSVEVWPEDMEYDDAEEDGNMEYFTLG